MNLSIKSSVVPSQKLESSSIMTNSEYHNLLVSYWQYMDKLLNSTNNKNKEQEQEQKQVAIVPVKQ